MKRLSADQEQQWVDSATRRQERAYAALPQKWRALINIDTYVPPTSRPSFGHSDGSINPCAHRGKQAELNDALRALPGVEDAATAVDGDVLRIGKDIVAVLDYDREGMPLWRADCVALLAHLATQ